MGEDVTTTAEPTTAEPSDSPTPKTTTDEPTATPTEEGSWPTPRPTMKSALKWEMIHPAYNGGDGELLWHVYYGDFSNDDRFDSFRSNEMWDAEVITPILKQDPIF